MPSASARTSARLHWTSHASNARRLGVERRAQWLVRDALDGIGGRFEHAGLQSPLCALGRHRGPRSGGPRFRSVVGARRRGRRSRMCFVDWLQGFPALFQMVGSCWKWVMIRRMPLPTCSARGDPCRSLPRSSFAKMSQVSDAVWRQEHVVEHMPRKPLDSFSGRDRVGVVESSMHSLAAAGRFVGSKRDAGPDAKQVELLATRRPIVSTTDRPRETLMACCRG